MHNDTVASGNADVNVNVDVNVDTQLALTFVLALAFYALLPLFRSNKILLKLYSDEFFRGRHRRRLSHILQWLL